MFSRSGRKLFPVRKIYGKMALFTSLFLPAKGVVYLDPELRVSSYRMTIFSRAWFPDARLSADITSAFKAPTGASPAAQAASSMSTSHAASLDFDVDMDSASPASSLALQGSSPAKLARQLSPLRLPSPMDFTSPSTPLFNPRSPVAPMSPISSLLHSPPSLLRGKWTAAASEEEEEKEDDSDTDDDGEDGDHDDASSPNTRLKTRRVGI
ncbi:hypothetical protein DFH06DRAFT_1484839 [Mycena polygramma]|nr:hypothetical protein DFH06DRAFT_1484839 [Mycena polygramma]